MAHPNHSYFFQARPANSQRAGRTDMRLWLALVGVLAAAALAGCQPQALAQTPTPTPTPTPAPAPAPAPIATPTPAAPLSPVDAQATETAKLQALKAQIATLAGTAACTQTTQCRALGVSTSACGGTTAWVPWSTATTSDAQALQMQEAATQLMAIQRARFARLGMQSTCRSIPTPVAACEAQRCVLKAADSANSPNGAI